MKIKTKLFCAFFSIAIIVTIFAYYDLSEINKISFIAKEIGEAENISKVALDFNVENFHTQLEMWEYALDPNQERLDAFQSHRETLIELLDKWLDEVYEEDYEHESFPGLYDTGRRDMEQISSDFKLVDQDWNVLLDTIEKLRTARYTGASDAEIKQLEFVVLQAINNNEALFDGLEFNRNVDNFVNSQQEIVDNYEKQIELEISQFMYITIVAVMLVIAFGLIIGYFVSRSIMVQIKKLKNGSIKLANREFTELKISGNDEISDLTKSFNKMANELSKNQNELIKAERLKSIGELASHLAHDLRNPLSIIRTTNELVRIKTGKDGYLNITKNTDVINSAVDRMAYQIESVLDFIRTKALVLEEHSIQSIIEKALETIHVPQNVTINLEKNDAKIICDLHRISIVFTNLITNAIQAIGENSGKITIHIKNNDNQVSCEIIDSGPGIPEMYLKKIFEVLYTTKRTGTGLGLASCKVITEKHGGTISVKNNPTTFTVTLPKIITVQNQKE